MFEVSTAPVRREQAQIAALDGLAGGFEDAGEASPFGCVLPIDCTHRGDIGIEQDGGDLAARCSRLHTIPCT